MDAAGRVRDAPVQFFAGLNSTVRALPEGGLYLLSAYRAWDCGWRIPRLPKGAQIACDCGAFSAFVRNMPLPFDLDTYVTWLYSLPVRPLWAASIDVIGDPAATEANWRDVLARYPNVPWAWVCTAHGSSVSEYPENARRLLAIGQPKHPEFRMGVGGLVPRPVSETVAIVQALSAVGVPLHLWGGGLRDLEAVKLSSVRSTDTAAWERTNTPRAGIERRPGERRMHLVVRQLAAYRALIES